MIELLAALALQSSLQDEAAVLIQQSANRVINSYGDMAEALGECSAAYPGGAVHPYVMAARRDVAAIGWDVLSEETARVESVLYAEASQRAGRGLTVQTCAERIEGAANDVSAHAAGLAGLLDTLRRSKR